MDPQRRGVPKIFVLASSDLARDAAQYRIWTWLEQHQFPSLAGLGWTRIWQNKITLDFYLEPSEYDAVSTSERDRLDWTLGQWLNPNTLKDNWRGKRHVNTVR